jgi:hypothetical protein
MRKSLPSDKVGKGAKLCCLGQFEVVNYEYISSCVLFCRSLARRIYGPSSSPMKSVFSIGLPFNEPNCPKHKTQMILYPILNSGKKKNHNAMIESFCDL